VSWLANNFPEWVALRDRLVEPWTVNYAARDELDLHILERLNNLEARMTSAENDAYARAAEVVGLIKAEFASLRQQVQDAATAGAAALEQDAQADADRINGLIDELASVLPAEVPDVPVPAPGEAAELPDDSSGGGDVGGGDVPAGGEAGAPEEPVADESFSDDSSSFDAPR